LLPINKRLHLWRDNRTGEINRNAAINLLKRRPVAI
jgi:hypothetical protein